MLIIPGMLFTFVFFVVPLITLLKISLSTKPDRLLPNYEFTWEWSNFSTAFDQFGTQLARAFAYAGIATVLCLLIAYPVAYFIAFKAGTYRYVLLGLVMVPFFTSFLLRTIAWQSLLNDNGPVIGVIEWLSIDGFLERIGILDNGRLLNTQAAVIGGLTYNFLPFMLLPIYVSLEKVDIRLVDAASDLYSPFGRTFRKVILPLSLPGVFAGTLLTFIPATGDFINAELLGNPNTQRDRQRRADAVPRAQRLPDGGRDQLRDHGDHHGARAGLLEVPRHGGHRMSGGEACGASSWGTLALWVVTIFGFAYLFIPLITIAVFSFNQPEGRFNTSWNSFTWDNWTNAFQSSDYTDAFVVSLRVAFVACTIATILGALIALALARYRMLGGTVLNLLLVLPLTTPEIVFGASLFTLFFNQGVSTGVLDDRHRPHDVLPVVRRAHGQGPHPWPRLVAGGRRRRPRLAAAADLLQDHVPADPARGRRRLPAVAVAVDRRLHHHVVHRRQRVDVPPGDLRLGEGRDPAPDPRHRHPDHGRGHRDPGRRNAVGQPPPGQAVVAAVPL